MMLYKKKELLYSKLAKFLDMFSSSEYNNNLNYIERTFSLDKPLKKLTIVHKLYKITERFSFY